MGSDLVQPISNADGHVSIHAPTWGATCPWLSDDHPGLFQSTLPHGERPEASAPKLPIICFNPRSHMGSDITERLSNYYFDVSIHAPTWGATIETTIWASRFMFQSTLPHGERRARDPRRRRGQVSIHAPTWGATNIRQPFTFIKQVSIHAPTWGATFLRLIWLRLSSSFNPRSHMGSDSPNQPVNQIGTMFQSTLPHGERLSIAKI